MNDPIKLASLTDQVIGYRIHANGNNIVVITVQDYGFPPDVNGPGDENTQIGFQGLPQNLPRLLAFHSEDGGQTWNSTLGPQVFATQGSYVLVAEQPRYIGIVSTFDTCRFGDVVTVQYLTAHQPGPATDANKTHPPPPPGPPDRYGVLTHVTYTFGIGWGTPGLFSDAYTTFNFTDDSIFATAVNHAGLISVDTLGILSVAFQTDANAFKYLRVKVDTIIYIQTFGPSSAVIDFQIYADSNGNNFVVVETVQSLHVNRYTIHNFYGDPTTVGGVHTLDLSDQVRLSGYKISAKNYIVFQALSSASQTVFAFLSITVAPDHSFSFTFDTGFHGGGDTAVVPSSLYSSSGCIFQYWFNTTQAAFPVPTYHFFVERRGEDGVWDNTKIDAVQSSQQPGASSSILGLDGEASLSQFNFVTSGLNAIAPIVQDPHCAINEIYYWKTTLQTCPGGNWHIGES